MPRTSGRNQSTTAQRASSRRSWILDRSTGLCRARALEASSPLSRSLPSAVVRERGQRYRTPRPPLAICAREQNRKQDRTRIPSWCAGVHSTQVDNVHSARLSTITLTYTVPRRLPVVRRKRYGQPTLDAERAKAAPSTPSHLLSPGGGDAHEQKTSRQGGGGITRYELTLRARTRQSASPGTPWVGSPMEH